MVVFGRGREREQRRIGSEGEVDVAPGRCVASPGGSGKRQAGGGRGACARTAATRPPAHWQEVEDDREEPLVGWAGFAQLAATVPGQVGFAR